MSEGPVTYAMPTGVRLRLSHAPRLESWNARDHPDQVRLRQFVDHVRELVEPVAEDLEGPLAFQLDVGLDEGVDPLWQRDLDNYLYPIARQLSGRFVSMWATKGRASGSFVTIGPAQAVAPPDWPAHRVPVGPGGESAWKQRVRQSVEGVHELERGPVGLQIALTVGLGRSWANSWKRTIDGLEPLLGSTYSHRDWNPQDGRIVRLGLHMSITPELGHNLAATIFARTGDLEWPELEWLNRMTDRERRAFMDAHDAVIAKGKGASPKRTSGARVGGPAGKRRRQKLEAEALELKGLADFEAAVSENRMIVKTDSAGPPKLHFEPKLCRGVTAENFRVKIVEGGGRNGRYYRAEGPLQAKQLWPSVRLCGVCRQLNPAAASGIEAAFEKAGT